jgi:hypothetical protein
MPIAKPCRQPTPRTAKALVASALASEILLIPGVRLPRVFAIEGCRYVIENGCAKRMLKLDMIHVEAGGSKPEDELFIVTQSGFNAVVRLLGHKTLIDLGVLEPD